jgi:hypothetical protein
MAWLICSPQSAFPPVALKKLNSDKADETEPIESVPLYNYASDADNYANLNPDINYEFE